jgi:hypothetical protein
VKTVRQPGTERAHERAVRAPAEVVLDRYRLCERLGSGGFGTVWRGHDERLDREVAVKRIPRAAGDRGSRGEDDRRRAAREVLAAARLSHPGIVALYEAGADDDAYYIVSELVHGRTLAELFAGDELSDAQIADIGAGLADALAHAHARGIVHRDVKPQNVIVPDDPARSAWPKLTDFGVARIAGSDPLTRTGDVVGTLAYMAPEQAAGRSVGPQADLFSLALVLYEGVAGFNPARGDSPAETARRLGRPLPPLARERRDLPPALCATLDRALSLDPARRGTLADLRAGLLEARESLNSEAPAAPPRAPAVERPRRQPWWWGLRAVAPLEPPQRLFAGATAAALTAAALAWIGPRAPVAPWWGLVAGAAVALLPRAGWMATAAAGVCWLLFAGQPGTALLLAVALAVVPLLMPRTPALWSLPALAPALGALGVAAAFPAVVGQLRGPWRRASLAALGLWWLLLAEPVLGRRLLLGVAAGTRDRLSWQGSAVDAFDHALVPLLRGGALGVALIWALAALALPVLLRAQRASAHAAAAALWSLVVAGATAALAQAMRAHLAPPQFVWLSVGAAAAVGAVVLGCALRDSRRRPAAVSDPA